MIKCNTCNIDGVQVGNGRYLLVGEEKFGKGKDKHQRV